MKHRSHWPLAAALVAVAFAGLAAQQDDRRGFRFRTGVELINVTATVTDGSGRFVSGLRRDDFRVFEDDRQVPVTHFSNERVPVSLGILLDTSGSMDGERIESARSALERFLHLLSPEDEIFLYTFDSSPELVLDWTSDRRRLRAELARVRARGGTAMYDAVAEALPLAQTGRHPKKALLLVSDGNDTSSRTGIGQLKQMLRESEVLVYAIGIDGSAPATFTRGRGVPPPAGPRLPVPFPFPGRRPPPAAPPPSYPSPRGSASRSSSDRLNVAALRQITDDSGGRTEIIRSARDLEPATHGVADELSQQYYLGYPAPGERDGRWRAIRVEVLDGSYRVRARRGYVATP